MHRVLFSIGSVSIYSYGVMLAIAFIAATLVARYRYRQQYKNPDIVLDYVLAAVVGGIVGARLFYVVGHWSEYAKNPGQIFKINMDGLVFYGGLIVGLGLTLLVAWLRKQKFWSTMDLAGICVPLGLGIGRIGCLLNGCCYGKTTTLPWGITYPVSSGIIGARQPTQIYELILDVALFGLLWWKKDSFQRDGTAFWLFVMGYGAIRFTMELMREHSTANAGLTFQLISLVFFVVAASVLLFRYRLLPAARSDGDLF
jgi:phosphatidylglycerol:prolipoprotein diacylglycerol transferase